MSDKENRGTVYNAAKMIKVREVFIEKDYWKKRED